MRTGYFIAAGKLYCQDMDGTGFSSVAQSFYFYRVISTSLTFLRFHRTDRLFWMFNPFCYRLQTLVCFFSGHKVAQTPLYSPFSYLFSNFESCLVTLLWIYLSLGGSVILQLPLRLRFRQTIVWYVADN